MLYNHCVGLVEPGQNRPLCTVQERAEKAKSKLQTASDHGGGSAIRRDESHQKGGCQAEAMSLKGYARLGFYSSRVFWAAAQ